MELFLTALFITLLGVAYVKGFDAVRQRSPEHLVHFYLMMATIRMVLIATVVVLYVLLAPDRESAIHFAGIIMLMYALMMVITLFLRH